MIDAALGRQYRILPKVSLKVSMLTLWVLGITTLLQIWEVAHIWQQNWQGGLSSIVFAVISFILLLAYARTNDERSFPVFTIYFLLSTFTMIIAWRISALLHLHYVPYIYLLAFALKVVNYALCGLSDLRESKGGTTALNHRSAYEWQLMTIRIFIGFDFIPHFTEKLFAGTHYRALDIASFQHLGVPHPAFFVVLAGLIEFGACFSIGCGFLTRIGALGAFVYLMVATILGKHFDLGFIWAGAGGGWEFPVFWGLLILSFAMFGADAFSLDHALVRRYNPRRWIRWLMGARAPVVE